MHKLHGAGAGSAGISVGEDLPGEHPHQELSETASAGRHTAFVQQGGPNPITGLTVTLADLIGAENMGKPNASQYFDFQHVMQTAGLCDTVSPGIDQNTRESFNYQNLLRVYPNICAELMENWLIRRENDYWDQDTSAAIEARDECATKEPLEAYTWDDRLHDAACLHAEHINQVQMFSHYWEDGTAPGDRLANYGQSWGWVGENLVAGENNALDNLLLLIEDLGIPSRGHRIAIFSDEFLSSGLCWIGDYFAYGGKLGVYNFSFWTRDYSDPDLKTQFDGQASNGLFNRIWEMVDVMGCCGQYWYSTRTDNGSYCKVLHYSYNGVEDTRENCVDGVMDQLFP